MELLTIPAVTAARIHAGTAGDRLAAMSSLFTALEGGPAQDVLPGIDVREPEYAERLLPAKRFPEAFASNEECIEYFGGDGRADRRGERSGTLDRRARAMSMGWPVPTDGVETYVAFHAPFPDRRQRWIIRAWAKDATEEDVFDAYNEQAFSIRMFVAALHRAGMHAGRLARVLNPLARSARGAD